MNHIIKNMSNENSLFLNKELVSIEKEVESIDSIKEWTTKLKKMKEMKDKISIEKNRITSFIEMINSNEIKKTKKKKDVSLDDLVKDFNNTDDMDSKVKLFCQIQGIIRETESELFE